MNKKNLYFIAIFGSFTLGLAPFAPEPHLFGKVKWVLGGAEGMAMKDWLDLLMHGAPFLLLVGLIIYDMAMRFTTKKTTMKTHRSREH